MKASIMKFASSKLACISLAFSALEVMIVWGPVALVNAAHKPDIASIMKLTSMAWLLGGLGSVVFGIVALVVDEDRTPGLAALGLGVLAFFFCGLTMAV
jgi:hypothetical protein